MKSLHWTLVSLVIIALLGIPTWYSMTGAGAAAIPGPEIQTLRSTQSRKIVGGGTRLGK